MKKRRNFRFKTAAVSFAAIATSLMIGMTAACSSGDNTGDDEETVATKQDVQVIKNGNFEFYSDNDGLYPISTPDNWTSGTSGSSSTALSGVIKTSKKGWDYLTDPTLPQTLEDNDDLKSDDENKKDYNGALTDDMLYKNTHEATETNADEEKKAYIDNPFTHEYRYTDDGVVNSNGESVTTYEDEDGKLYLDEDLKTELDTSVLMIHNYRSGTNYDGTETYFNSSTTISLEASTAAEISVWVKTDEMYFANNSERTIVDGNRGAYIKIETQVGGNSLETFEIKNIDTSKLNPKPEEGDWENNGWVEYTIYVEASNFAETTVSVTLGLGENDRFTVEGYAFFDDVTFTKYINADKLADENGEFSSRFVGDSNLEANEDCIYYPLRPKDEVKNEFRTDVTSYQTNDAANGNALITKEDRNNFDDRHFLIDFTRSSIDQYDLHFDSTIKAGLTTEDTSSGKYVCVKPANTNVFTNNVATLENGASDANTYVPSSLIKNGIDVSADLITTTSVSEDEWTFSAAGATYEYNALLTDALKSAASLPGANGSTDAFLILSARGAAYEAEITNDNFKLADGEYALISFWMKTSDLTGGTAAKVTAIATDDKDNNSSFTVDTTTAAEINIGDDEEGQNVYKGWVRCFIRVSNTSKEAGDKTFKLKVNYGNTGIKGTSKSSYKAGWLALANASIMTLDEDVYGYTSGSSYTATLSFTETEANTTHNFDTELGDKNEIKSTLATPSSYTGVNGGSINVTPTGETAGEYDKTNANPYAGILNKEFFDEGNYDGENWRTALREITAVNGVGTGWNDIFDAYAVQPLLIVNRARTIDGESNIYNYGYIGKSSSVSADGYTAVSVRVKASKGAIANVYLVEDKNSDRGVLSYSLPKYNFWYDDDGNILKSEPDENATPAEKKANIAYTLRKDGLYENGDGKLYANIYNYTRYYDEYEYEGSSYYETVDGAYRLLTSRPENGKIYYGNASGTAYGNHYLISGEDGNSKLFEYYQGVGENTCYYYIENGVANEKKVVYGIDTSFANDNGQTEATPYRFTVDTIANPEYADKWITVTFYVHAGNESKDYRLELWSGERENKVSAGVRESYIVFDYSNVSVDATSYEELLNAYTDDIIRDYKETLTDKVLDGNDYTIDDFEKLAESNSALYNYIAHYYTYSLFDSPAYIPFNGETAEDGQTGYSYNYSDYSKSLAFLKVEDLAKENSMSMSAFIDYSAVDKEVEIISSPTVDEDTTDDDDSDSSTDTNFWLLIASIALVVAILIAIIAIFIRNFVKKRIPKKTAGKNSYNFNKNKRYVKKYVKANGEAPEIAEGEVDESLLNDQPEAEEAKAGNGAEPEEVDGAKGEEKAGESGDATPSAEQPESEVQDEAKSGDQAQSESEAQPGQKPEDGADDGESK